MGSKQYWVYMLNALFDAIFCSVDAAFGNNISTDVIAALGSFWVIHGLLTQCVGAGIFAYQVWRRHPRNCLMISVSISAVLGVLLAVLHVPVAHIFELTESQYKMLEQCLLLDGLTLPIGAASRFMTSYITYSCMNKLMISSNIITYVLLILTDYIAVQAGWSCVGLVATTIFTWLIQLLITVVGCKFWTVRDKVRLGHIFYGLKKAINLVIYRVVSRVANVVFGYFASTLGSDYVIHTMCINITSLADPFRGCIYHYQLVAIKATSHKTQTCVDACKKFYISNVLVQLTYCVITLVCIHGKVPFMDALPFLILYFLPFLIVPVYDSVRAYLVTTDKTNIMVRKSVISCIFRIPLTALFVYLGFGLYGIASILFLEMFVMTVYYLKNCNWLRQGVEIK